MYKIFIVEDDLGIANAIEQQATLWDFQVHIVSDFQKVIEEFNQFDPHIVLLDITLPFKSGYHWCSEIRKISSVPIIFVSATSDNMNIVMTVNLGADDFIAKPFDLNVLMAKIQALLRRTYDYVPKSQRLSHRDAYLDTGASLLTYNDQSIDLTKNEYRILFCLMENKGTVVSREKLMEKLWETDIFVDENTLTVNVNRLRKKLDSIGLNDFIITKFGVGYMVG